MSVGKMQVEIGHVKFSKFIEGSFSHVYLREYCSGTAIDEVLHRSHLPLWLSPCLVQELVSHECSTRKRNNSCK